MRDCSTCRDSRGLITWARVCARDSFLLSSAWNGDGAGVCGEPRIQREWERERERDTRTRPTPPQSAGSIDSRFLRRGRNCLCREIKAALCFVLEDRSPSLRANCRRTTSPDKLRAYKCSIRRTTTTTHCLRGAFAFTRTLRAPASSSRGRRDCGRNQLAGNAGLFRLTRFVGPIVRLYGSYLAAKKYCGVQSSEVIRE